MTIINKIRIFAAATLTLAVSGCDDYFEPDYTGSIPEEKFYDNINSLRMGLNSVYNVVQSKNYEFGELLFGLGVSDDAWAHQDVSSGTIPDILNFTFDTQNEQILTRYRTQYLGINKANQVIRNVGNVPFKNNGSTKKEIREVYGQAKVLRAMFYFNLVKTFGGVSIQPEHQELGSLIVPRSTVQEVYAYIEKDLREAVLLLRKGRYQQAEAGQIGVGGGLGLLMKVLLYEASPGTDIPADVKAAKWKEAYEIGRYFIEGEDITVNDLLKFDERYSGIAWKDFAAAMFLEDNVEKESVLAGSDIVNLHRLDDFDNIFRLAGEFSIESLIEINHFDFSGLSSDIDEGWGLYNNFIHQNASGVSLSPVATKDLYNAMNNDPRRMYTITGRIYNEYFCQEGTISLKSHDAAEGYLFMKTFLFPSEGSEAGRNYRVMRYAEALLIYAEILLENQEPRRAVDYVNKVRQRARKLIDSANPNARYNPVKSADFKDISYAPYDITREAILKEKRIEMAGECDRWFEVCRLGKAYERQLFLSRNLPTEASGKIRQRGQHFKKGINEIYPIPYKEVYTSNGVIKQNFGY